MCCTRRFFVVAAVCTFLGGCAEKHVVMPQDGGPTASECYAAGLGEPPITCPAGCVEIHGSFAEGCWSGSASPSGVVGCKPSNPGGILPELDCFVRERDGGVDLVVVTSNLEPTMTMQGYAECLEIPECPSGS